jgi:hypothetical protein
MKKLAVSLANAGAFATIALGLAGPASAAVPASVNHDAVYSAHTAVVQPVDCHVHVNYQGSDVDVNWC